MIWPTKIIANQNIPLFRVYNKSCGFKTHFIYTCALRAAKFWVYQPLHVQISPDKNIKNKYVCPKI